MPKRKLKEEPSADGPDLSLPPDGLLDEDATAKGHTKETKRRKVTQITTKTETVKAVKEKQKVDVDEDLGSEEIAPKKKRQRQQQVKKEAALNEDDEVVKEKATRKRKTKEEKEAENMPLATRSVGHRLFIGAHVSSAGGNLSPIIPTCISE